MRLPLAWAKVAYENVTLKVATSVLAVSTVTSVFVIGLLSLKEPLVIERGCTSRVLNLSNNEHSKDEIESFLLEALPLRFSAESSNEAYFSEEENQNRIDELKQLASKGIKQKFSLDTLAVMDNEALVTGDRVIAAGPARSAIPIKLKVKIFRTRRSLSNPYGLILGEISQIKEESKNGGT